MANNWFLTGQPGVGKSTIIYQLANQLEAEGLRPGGLVSPEIRDSGSRAGFHVRDLLTGRTEVMAHKQGESPMRVGQYKVMAHNIDAICSEAFPYAFQQADVILVDEIGPMELYSQGFKHFVKQAVEQPVPLLAAIHQKARASFIRELKKQSRAEPWQVTETNRDELPSAILDEFRNVLKK